MIKNDLKKKIKQFWLREATMAMPVDSSIFDQVCTTLVIERLVLQI